ncbi:AEC family transporter [Ignatzschineria rhizosphaerae]|uniref:AEC family transporter n=1 Tax=Ignatzschineria rhizosphaerae TaxID=2923279 RepID=A0ABY3X5V0_9GAMM|nr:AEC family transporter [Ignatzschineria rhizosphaerae]UNM97129.1 AEC family transporter [Ignatzschineria rhizosphaerae]
MISTIITALLPIFLTVLLGYFAGKQHKFNADQGAILNKMVMLYALPLSLFSGMLANKRSQVLQLEWVFLLLALAFIVGYIIVFFISYKIFKREIKVAVLQALAITCPSVPFVGTPVLGYIYGDISIIPIAISALIMNLFQVPFAIYILSMDENSDNRSLKAIGNNIKKTFIEPVVWAPITAFILLIANVSIPDNIRSAFQLLGNASSGVALFSAGIMMYSYQVTFSKNVAISVVSKNFLLPIAIALVGFLLNIKPDYLNISVIIVAIPSATISTILAIQYKVAEKEMTSTLFYSIIVSVVSMSLFLALFH